MPDWSYRTLLRPVLFALPAEMARQLTMRVLSGIAGVSGGALIDFLGHMRADARLATDPWATPVGLGATIDPEGQASAAFAHFGVGFIELGPVRAQGPAARFEWQRDVAARSLQLRGQRDVKLADLLARLRSMPKLKTPILVRISASEPEPATAVQALQPWAAGFSCEAQDVRDVSTRVAAAVSACDKPVWVSLRADQADALELANAALAAGAHGIWIRAELSSGVYGAPVLPEVLERVRELRAGLPANTRLIAGGVSEPADVRELEQAGAQSYVVDTGLVFGGPGLIKRCNEALLHAAHGGERAAPEPLTLQAARSAWFWALCLGVAMLAGGLLALTIANTRVVLPYDEALCGLKRAQLNSINPRILPFMQHDRTALAGSMLSVGIFYSALALHAIRRGAHWAQVTVVVSSFAGFLMFFGFLGFEYFDPFHAFVSSVLLQFQLLCMAMPLGAADAPASADWRETAAWRAGLWGQLLFAGMGISLVAAGAVISFIGTRFVFVSTDLEFLRTTVVEMLFRHESLVPLVAHDRASLGGMLISNGIVILLCALWGMRAGERWLWHALAWGGNVAFVTAIAVHYVVGYESLTHLAPAFAGLAIWWLALLLTRAWLCAEPGEMRC